MDTHAAARTFSVLLELVCARALHQRSPNKFMIIKLYCDECTA